MIKGNDYLVVISANGRISMKKVILILGTMLIFLSMASPVYAGTINEYEQEVIDLAKGVYEYNGIDYQVDPAYIDQLISYLSGDDIDLTAEQRDKVEQKAFSSVAQGVEEGYLIPVKEESNDYSEGDEQSIAKEDSTTDSGQGHATDIGEQKNTQSKGNNQAEKTKNQVTTDSTKTENIQSEPKISDNTLKDTSNKALDQTIAGTISTDGEQATSTQLSDNDDMDIIKNTGFDLSNSAWIVIALGMLMASCVYITFRYNLFTQGKEHENNE
jgi:hypothetical protein